MNSAICALCFRPFYTEIDVVLNLLKPNIPRPRQAYLQDPAESYN